LRSPRLCMPGLAGPSSAGSAWRSDGTRGEQRCPTTTSSISGTGMAAACPPCLVVLAGELGAGAEMLRRPGGDAGLCEGEIPSPCPSPFAGRSPSACDARSDGASMTTPSALPRSARSGQRRRNGVASAPPPACSAVSYLQPVSALGAYPLLHSLPCLLAWVWVLRSVIRSRVFHQDSQSDQVLSADSDSVSSDVECGHFIPDQGEWASPEEWVMPVEESESEEPLRFRFVENLTPEEKADFERRLGMPSKMPSSS